MRQVSDQQDTTLNNGRRQSSPISFGDRDGQVAPAPSKLAGLDLTSSGVGRTASPSARNAVGRPYSLPDTEQKHQAPLLAELHSSSSFSGTSALPAGLPADPQPGAVRLASAAAPMSNTAVRSSPIAASGRPEPVIAPAASTPTDSSPRSSSPAAPLQQLHQQAERLGDMGSQPASPSVVRESAVSPSPLPDSAIATSSEPQDSLPSQDRSSAVNEAIRLAAAASKHLDANGSPAEGQQLAPPVRLQVLCMYYLAKALHWNSMHTQVSSREQ